MPRPYFKTEIMEWISVKDKLPENPNADCLVVMKGVVQSLWYRCVGGEWFYLGDFNQLSFTRMGNQITHWAEIKPPQDNG